MSAKKSKTAKAKRKPGKVRKMSASVGDGNPELATLDMAAAIKQTGKSMGYIYRCMRLGKLPAFKVARQTLFRQSDIDKLMTPVPYVPVGERGYKATPKAVKRARPKASKKSSPKKTVSGKARPADAGRRPSKGLKASVAKALKGMTTETPVE